MFEESQKTEEKLKIEGLLGWIQSKKEESKKDGKSWGWLLSAIASVIVFVSLAFIAYESWKKGKEIAKLKHEIDVENESKLLAEANKQVALCTDKIKEFEKSIEKSTVNVEKLKIDILKLEADRKQQHDKIDKITSWEDVAAFLKD